MSTRWFHLLAAAAFTAAPALVLADDPAKPEGDRDAVFKRLDANGDGQVTEDEVGEEQQRLFKRLLRTSDKNNDGKLSLDEFREGTKDERPQRAPEGGGPGRPGAPGGGDPAAYAEEIFKRADANGDGKVTLDEVPEDRRERFQKMIELADKDGDKALTLDEFRKGFVAMNQGGQPGQPQPGQPQQGGFNPEAFFKRLDANGDGKLTADEAPPEARERIEAMLARADENGDKALSLDEFRKAMGGGRPGNPGNPPSPQGPPPAVPDALFRALDANGDGSISKDEIYNAAESLRKLDKDNDGAISRNEAGAPGRPMGPPPGGPDGRPNADGRPNFDGSEFAARMLKEQDKNGDGKLSKDEVGERMKENFDRIDANSDGFIDLQELKQVAARMMGGRRPDGAPQGDQPRRSEGSADGRSGAGEYLARMLKERDTNGDGKLSKDEVGERMKENFDKLDKNGDGFIDADELKAMASQSRGPQGQGGDRPKRPE